MMQPTSLPPKHLSAGIVLVHHDGTRFRFLCLRAFEAWDFPKAPVDDESEAVTAAIEELRESTGIEDPAFHWGEDYRETVPFDDNTVSRYYLAESPTMDVDLRVPFAAEAREDYEYRWTTVDEAEDLLPPRLALVLDWAVNLLARPSKR
ncbi:MAG TPA: NUDIX domain-containing protein [Burkholderiales bacterium]|nr:NUDIX domain-containing protein [Burkholderiales bacterium]